MLVARKDLQRGHRVLISPMETLPLLEEPALARTVTLLLVVRKFMFEDKSELASITLPPLPEALLIVNVHDWQV